MPVQKTLPAQTEMPRQNLSFGPTNTNKMANIHMPIIMAYSLSRPNKPSPSLMRVSEAMVLLARFIDETLRSRPSSARESRSLSLVASVAAKACDCCFSCTVRERRELVRVSCSRDEACSLLSVETRLAKPDVVADVGDGLEGATPGRRRVMLKSSSRP